MAKTESKLEIQLQRLGFVISKVMRNKNGRDASPSPFNHHSDYKIIMNKINACSDKASCNVWIVYQADKEQMPSVAM